MARSYALLKIASRGGCEHSTLLILLILRISTSLAPAQRTNLALSRLRDSFSRRRRRPL